MAPINLNLLPIVMEKTGTEPNGPTGTVTRVRVGQIKCALIWRTFPDGHDQKLHRIYRCNELLCVHSRRDTKSNISDKRRQNLDAWPMKTATPAGLRQAVASLKGPECSLTISFNSD